MARCAKCGGFLPHTVFSPFFARNTRKFFINGIFAPALVPFSSFSAPQYATIARPGSSRAGDQALISQSYSRRRRSGNGLKVIRTVLAQGADEIRRKGIALVNIAADLADKALLFLLRDSGLRLDMGKVVVIGHGALARQCRSLGHLGDAGG